MVTYQPSSDKDSFVLHTGFTDGGDAYIDAANGAFWLRVDSLLAATYTFYIRANDDASPTVGTYIWSQQMTLVVNCGSVSLDIETAPVVTPSSNLDALPIVSTDDLFFTLTGITNRVTGCPITGVELYTLASDSGSSLTQATFVSNTLDAYKFKVTQPAVA